MNPPNRVGIIVALFIGAVLIGVGVATLFNAQYAVEPIGASTIQTQVPTQRSAETPSAPSSVPAMFTPQAAVQDIQATSNPTSFPASPTVVIAPATSTLQVTEAVTPQPSSTVQPTNVATPQPSPQSTELATTQPPSTTSMPSAEGLRQQVAAAEEALQGGRFEATIEYAKGSRSDARILFAFGNAVETQRLSVTTTYQGDEGPLKTEQITVGDVTWSRQTGSQWAKAPAQINIREQVQPFLPNVSSMTNPTIVSNTSMVVLRWYDSARDAEVTLMVDSTTGVPQQMRQLTRATGSVLTVNYSGWNEAVDIKPPDTN